MNKDTWKRYLYQIIASEISEFSRFFKRMVQIERLPSDGGEIFSRSVCKEKDCVDSLEKIDPSHEPGSLYFINGNFNHSYDIQGFLQSLKPKLNREDRVTVVLYNAYLSWIFRFASLIKLRKGKMPSTFVTRLDLDNISKISGFEVVRLRMAVYFPFRLLGIGNIINATLPMVPLLRWLGLVSVVVLRPIKQTPKPTLTVVVPARNEKGNIEGAITRIPAELKDHVEIVFVEGHSTDQTWEEILRVADIYKDDFKIQTFRQTGKGKADAVRLGFKKANGQLLTILDADLTMPPELLPRFYDAYCNGEADFINGSRLVYPMEGNAMRFLNLLGNKFFAKALSFVLDNRLSDSLCGTKMMTKADYERFVAWREYFGDFDPFGDFEMIFPASVLALGTVNIPIRYRDRVYGSTNISRFRHGLMLMKMTAVGLFRIKSGRVHIPATRATTTQVAAQPKEFL